MNKNHRLLWQQIPSPIVTEILCNCKYTGIVLDTEHASFSDETIYSCIQVATLAVKDCFVRVTHLDKKLVRMILDAGATGIIFSTIEDKKQAKEIYSWCHYPPKGKRGQGLVRENGWGEKPFSKVNPTLVGQIETELGVKNCESFSDYFDYFLIGPYDLSASLGVLGKFDSKKYKYSIKQIEKKIPKTKIGYHIVNNIEKQFNEDGYRNYSFLAFSMDTLMIIDNANEINKIII